MNRRFLLLILAALAVYPAFAFQSTINPGPSSPVNPGPSSPVNPGPSSPVFGVPDIGGSTINQGLVEFWPMTDGSGTTFADGAGTGNTQTLQAGTLTWGTNTGLPGTTPTFSATAYTQGSNHTATNFDGTTPFSISMWVKLSSSGQAAGQHTVISTMNPSASYQGFELAYDYSQGFFFYLNNVYPTNSLLVFQNYSTPDGLHYVVLTYDGSETAAGALLYVDGVAQALTAPLENSLSGSTASGINPVLGARVGATNEFNGVIAYTRIYNRVLSSTDVSTYFAAGAQ